MISRVLFALETALQYVKRNPQLLFVFLLIILLPLALLYTSDQFLEAGRTNQDKLQRDRFGLLHDSFVSILSATNFEVETFQTQVSQLVSVNPDITEFRLIKQTAGDFVTLVALDESVIGQPEINTGIYKAAAANFNESLLFEFFRNDVRYWQGVRAIQDPIGNFYYILTENSFEGVDSYLQAQERKAYVSLVIVYIILIGIAFWLVRLTNYRGLYEQTKQAVATKDMFTNMIAHELRAPLTAMRGYASMISESSQAVPESKQHAGRIKDSSERLLTIVNDLLDVARIQSGKLTVDKSTYKIAETIQAVVEELQGSAKVKNIHLVAEVSNELPVVTDPKRLHQILINVTSNAIKYTPEGAITIIAAEIKNGIEIRVQDTGMGISSSDQQQLFAPFFRVDSADVSQITGTGLGMWITRQMVELLGATIGVESIKGVGTHVVIVLPK